MFAEGAPWFEAYRELFLRLLPPAEHEFWRQLLGALFVVPSSNADPIDAFSRLMQQQHVHQFQQLSRQPRWFHSSTLRYYILLNDVRDGDRSRAESQFATMQATYGSTNCFLLHINSLPLRDGLQPVSEPANKKLEPAPDLWSRVIRLEFGSRDATSSGKASLQNLPEDSVIGDPMKTSSLSSSKSTMFGSQKVYDAVPVADPLSQADDFFPEMRHAVSYGSLPSAPNAAHEKESGMGSMQSNGAMGLPVSLAPPTHRGQCMSVGDAERVREMVEQLAEKCFVPFVERLFRSLAEQVNAVGGVGTTRRSGKSLLGGMKRIFGGSSSSSIARQAVEAVAGGSYASDSPELIQRRYADLALLLQQYELAYQVNNKLKNEFLSEHAWEHYAAAMELAGAASFLQEHRVYPTTLMEQAINRYLDNCKCACPSASASASALAHCRAAHSQFHMRLASSLHSTVVFVFLLDDEPLDAMRCDAMRPRYRYIILSAVFA